jgi:hypothetical protein
VYYCFFLVSLFLFFFPFCFTLLSYSFFLSSLNLFDLFFFSLLPSSFSLLVKKGLNIYIDCYTGYDSNEFVSIAIGVGGGEDN